MQEVMVTGGNLGWLQCRSSSVSVGSKCDPHFERLKVVNVSKPQARAGAALVRVMASSVNPTDWKHFLFMSGYVPGNDFAGTVVQADASCGFQAGDEVWGIQGGAYSEYISVDCGQLGLKPRNYQFVEAGSLGVVAMTGLQGLRWAGAPWSAAAAPRVLVTGGSSGTGHVGIQLAKALGAKEVITTCSPDHFGYVRGLGADRALDYHTENWWEVLPPGSVDVIYDCISEPGTGNRAYQVLADGGRFITLLAEAKVSPLVALTRPSVSQYYFICDQHATPQLDMVTQMAEAGQLNVTISKTYQGLSSIAAAFEETMKGHNVGKVAIQIGA